MSKSRYIDTCFWDDPYTSNLDPRAKLLYLYLLTNTLTNIAGVYEIQTKRIAFDTGFKPDAVDKMMSQFADDGKIYYDGQWLAIRNFIKHQRPNPKVKKGIEVILETVPAQIKRWLENPVSTIVNNDRLSVDYGKPSHLNLNSNLIKSNTHCTPPASKLEKPPDKDPETTEPYSMEFLTWWTTYGKHGSKMAAYRKYRATKRKKGATAQQLLTAAKNYRAATVDTDEKYIKHASTFLGPDEHWRDCLEVKPDDTDKDAERTQRYFEQQRKLADEIVRDPDASLVKGFRDQVKRPREPPDEQANSREKEISA